MMVALRNKTTGKIKLQKIGWSWTCLFFSCALGIPLLTRRLYGWALIMVAFWVINFYVEDDDLTIFILIAELILSVVLAVNANRMAGKNYLETGWEFSEPNSAEATVARQKWGLSPAAA